MSLQDLEEKGKSKYMSNLAAAVQILADGQRATAAFSHPTDPSDDPETPEDPEQTPEPAQTLQPARAPPTIQTLSHAPEPADAAAAKSLKSDQTLSHVSEPEDAAAGSLGTSQSLKADQDVERVVTPGQEQAPSESDAPRGGATPHEDQVEREEEVGVLESAGEDAGGTPGDGQAGPRETQCQLEEGQVEGMIGACLQVADAHLSSL